MKTIVCGPPHSGKTVLIANLLRFMPSDSYSRINANGDGEGTWSNNPDQDEVRKVRIKTNNSPEEFAEWEKQILNATQDLVLIDVGGKIQTDKNPLFDAADSFIVLSSDSENIQPWIEYGESHGCRCLAVLNSILDGEDKIISRGDRLYATISGLERGADRRDSVVVKALADHLVCESGYRRTELVDFFKVGEEIGCAENWTAANGMPVSHIHFETSAARLLRTNLCRKYKPHTRYRIYNLKTNWVAAIAADSLAGCDISSLSFYDYWTDSFVAPGVLSKVDGENPDMDVTIKETETEVFLSLRPKGLSLDYSRFREYVLPKIDESKTLYLSGRFPTWFTVSVLGSYSSKEQYLHQPGNHYICVRSDKEVDLGKEVIIKE